MHAPYTPATALRDFRDDFYTCLDRRGDALFDLTEALLTAGWLPAPVHLSSEPVHRRGGQPLCGPDLRPAR